MAAPRQSTEERREQIVEAALRIISTKGVHKLTAMEIGRQVGIADGTVFRHFADKATIVLGAIDHLKSLLFAQFPPEDPDPLARLRKLFVSRLELVRRHPGVFRLAFSDRLEEAAGVEGAARVRAMVARSQKFVRDCLEEAQRQGKIDPALPPAVLTWVVMGTMQMAAFAEKGNGREPLPDPETAWRTLETLLLSTQAK